MDFDRPEISIDDQDSILELLCRYVHIWPFLHKARAEYHVQR